MKRLLLRTYLFFSHRKILLYSVTAMLFTVLGILAMQLKIDDDVSRLLPHAEQTQQINDIFRSASFADKIIVKVVSRGNVQPEVLMRYADTLKAKLSADAEVPLAEIKLTVSDETALEIYNTVHRSLPLYLENEDYQKIDSLLLPSTIAASLKHDYEVVTSTQGFYLKKLIADDPVGISTLALQKLQGLQIDEHYELYDGYIMSKDHRGLYMFITLGNVEGKAAQNEKLFEAINKTVSSLNPQKDNVEILYYGNPVVAAGNALQLKKDSILTLSITVVLIALFIGFFFRKKRVPLIMMLPVLFGGMFSLAVIAVTKGAISSIAIGAGSVVLGIAVNYSLHFFSHYKHCGSIEQTIGDLLSPLTIGSITTVGSFLSLTLLQSQILNDFGLFASLSLLGATVFTLVFLPHFVPRINNPENTASPNRLERLFDFKVKYPGVVFLVIVVITAVLLPFAGKVGFESDLNTVNFLDNKTLKAKQEIDLTQDDTSKLVFVAVNGRTQEEMLRNNEMVLAQLKAAEKNGWLQKYSSFSRFIPSQKQQQEKIDRWNAYWTADRRENLLAAIRSESVKVGFSPTAFNSFESVLGKTYTPVDVHEFAAITEAIGKEYLITTPDRHTVINAVRVDKAQRKFLYAELNKNPFTVVLDKQIITNKFIDIIYKDFNAILLYTSLLVFFTLLFSYGRLELTIITFLPMVIAWIWILGIMGLFGLQFNLINIIISTFIFGLGDDFSIFITDGLTAKFKEGKELLNTHKVSIFLSAVTTVIGLGALIFAKHPALKSIALVSIIGIFCVFVVGQIVQPFLYNFFIQSRKEKGLPPWTIPTLLLFWIAFGYYVAVSLTATVIGYMLMYLVPYPGIKKRKLVFHHLMCYALRILTYMMVNVRKTHEGKEHMNFSKPAIIIANHASFLDILVTVMQHPKLILLTNKWVYYSPVFGKVVQLADYYPVMEGVDPGIEKFASIVKDGYSIVIFPEGTRSPDGNLKRFHKGAFYLAEQLKMDIVPLLLHGTGDTIKKGDFMVMNASMTMKFLPRITADNTDFGSGYAERTKKIGQYFKAAFEKLKLMKETPRYFRQRLRMNYIYKGTALELLAFSASRNESYYQTLNNVLPKQGQITVLGSGYGFDVYMLRFLSRFRKLTAIDADLDKVNVADNCYSKDEHIDFIHANVLNHPLPSSDAFLVNESDLSVAEADISLLLSSCFENMNDKGVLIYKGNKDLLKDFVTVEIFNSTYLVKVKK